MINRLIFQPPQEATYGEKTHKGQLIWIPKLKKTRELLIDEVKEERSNQESVTDSLSRVSSAFLTRLAMIPPFINMPELAQYRRMYYNQFENNNINTDNTDLLPMYCSRSMAALVAEQPGCNSVIMFMHGRASDIGESYDFMCRMRTVCETTVVGIEYPGYGVYVQKERPSELGMYERVLAGFDQIASQSNVRSIVIVGYSLGTTAACEIGQKRNRHHKLRGIVLISPFASIHQLIGDFTPESYMTVGLKRLLPDSHFANREALNKITIPVLIIHGNKDEIIPVGHAQTLSTVCKNSKLIVISGMTHNIHTDNYEPTVLRYTRDHIYKVMSPRKRTEVTLQKIKPIHNYSYLTTPTKRLFPKEWYNKPEDDDREIERQKLIAIIEKQKLQKQKQKEEKEEKERKQFMLANKRKSFRERIRAIPTTIRQMHNLYERKLNDLNLDKPLSLFLFGFVIFLLYILVRRYYRLYHYATRPLPLSTLHLFTPT